MPSMIIGPYLNENMRLLHVLLNKILFDIYTLLSIETDFFVQVSESKVHKTESKVHSFY